MEAPQSIEDFSGAILTAGTPSLVLTAPPGSHPRPGTLEKNTILDKTTSLADHNGAPLEPNRLLLLQGLSLLWHDRWDDAHDIAQSREGERDFDLLHAILHRREGDFANSDYWFRSVGKHPCYPILERRLASAPIGETRDILIPLGKWSPAAFVAEVRKNARGSSEPEPLIRVQAEEFHALAEWLLNA
ncbi:MAG: hypothetical protein M3Y08_01940 [Fibrobacterota bacterium]|nr:hypothetical protein [Fibrobacterota bacterium]